MITTDKNRVCVNGIWIEIEFCDPCSDKLYLDSKYVAGLFMGLDAKIFLSNRLSFLICRRTLMHEIMHAVILYSQIEGRKDSYTEENVCDIMGMYAPQITKSADDIMSHIDYIVNPSMNPDSKTIMRFKD